MVAPVPAADRAARERQIGMRDDALRVEELHRAQAVAARAGAHRIVEGEQARLELGQRVVAHRAGELARRRGARFRNRFRPRRPCRRRDAARSRGTRPGAAAHRRARAAGRSTTSTECLTFFARRGVASRSCTFAVDAHAREALRAQLLQRSACSPLRPATTGARIMSRLSSGSAASWSTISRDGLRLQRELVLGAVRRAGARVEKPQIVVDLGHGAHRRARVVARRLLLDRDRGRQALDQVHLGLRHQLEELARVRRERLDVAALAFGVERVEGERAFARARKAGDHHEPVARQLEAEVLQVVGARSADRMNHRGSNPCCCLRSETGYYNAFHFPASTLFNDRKDEPRRAARRREPRRRFRPAHARAFSSSCRCSPCTRRASRAGRTSRWSASRSAPTASRKASCRSRSAWPRTAGEASRCSTQGSRSSPPAAFSAWWRTTSGRSSPRASCRARARFRRWRWRSPPISRASSIAPR